MKTIQTIIQEFKKAIQFIKGMPAAASYALHR